MHLNPIFNESQRCPATDERKFYTPPMILISLPLEASAGSSQVGGRPGSNNSTDGWDDEW